MSKQEAHSLAGRPDVGNAELTVAGAVRHSQGRYLKALKRIALYAAVVVVCVYSFFPIYWMIVSSLRAPDRLFFDTSLLAWPPDFSSYVSLLQLTSYLSPHFPSKALISLS